ncbi:hypothetical protein [Bacillus sp. 491mf]|uniref:hypothetical protein n=1 Tax=Bacillus sp. 491mf TaxID=1761755 RepID=UPI000B8711AB|nr:hypothetical protein [Bacillus sp. 491mf]
MKGTEVMEKHFDFMTDFFDDMRSQEPMYVFIKGHLYLESIMIKMLESHFPHGLKVSMFSFAQKLELVRSIGFIDLEFFQALSKVNRVRNDLAHNLNVQIDDKVIEDILSILPKNVKEHVVDLSKETTRRKVTCLFFGLFSYLLFKLEHPNISV